MNRSWDSQARLDARVFRAFFVLSDGATLAHIVQRMPVRSLLVAGLSVTVIATDARSAPGMFKQTTETAVRPDPTLDPAVRGINEAQASAATRFGATQLDNVTARMRMLHLAHDPCATQIDIGTNIRWERQAGSNDGQAPAQNANKSEQIGTSLHERSRRCERPFALWAGGNIDFGFLRPSSAQDRSDFRTSGVTVGADMKVRDELIAGVALAYGRDETEVEAGGSANQARAQGMMLYGSFQPVRPIQLDAMLGYGDLSFDVRRRQATDTVMLSGDRDGSQYYGSLALSATWQSTSMKLAPYARFDHVRNRLDVCRESGAATAALTSGSTNVSQDSIAFGLHAGYSLTLGRATLEPGLRIEQQRVRIGSSDQAADLPQTGYVLSNAAESNDLTSAALSLLLRFRSWSVGVEYNYAASNDTFKNETTRATLHAPF